MNAQPQTIPVFTMAHNAVSARVNLISESGLIILKGTPGRILEWTCTGQLVIDFGAMPVFIIPSDSTLILVGGQR